MLRRISHWLRRRAHEDELSEEIAFHEAMKQQELEASGVEPARATHMRRRAMGNITQSRENARAVWSWPWLDSARQDLAYGVRMLRRHPGFTLAASVALAVGIGLTTSVFTVINGLVFRPWDVADSHRMISLTALDCCERAGGQPHGFALDEVAYFSKHARTINGIYLFRVGDGTMVSLDAGETKLRSAWVSPEYFHVLGIPVVRGRAFRADDVSRGVPVMEAVISYDTWQRRFAGVASVVDSVVHLDGQAFDVIGVAPRNFTGTFGVAIDVWLPLSAVPVLRPADSWVTKVLRQSSACCTSAAARLADGATVVEAQTELASLSRDFRASVGLPFGGVFLDDFTPLGGPPGSRTGVIQVFTMLGAAAGAVLLLACANVGNLLLARMASRQREIAVRLALGASRPRIIRQLLTEGLALAALGVAGGLAVAFWLPEPLVRVAMHGSAIRVRPDATVLAFTVAVGVVTCLVFALPPALHATLPPRTAGVRLPLRSVFLSAQVALCVVLLVSAGLLLRGIQRLMDENAAYAVREVTAVSFEFATPSLAATRTKPFVAQLSAAMSQLPDVGPVAISSSVPLRSTGKSVVRRPGEPEARNRDVLIDEVSPAYFDVLRIPRVAGRALEHTDVRTDAILVNATLAQPYGAPQSIVGSTLLVGGVSRQVVGVVQDFRASSLDRVEPTVYAPFSGDLSANVLLRNGTARAAAIAALARRIEPSVGITIAPLSTYLERRLSAPLILARVSGALGLIALVLATIGVFGVFAFAVQQRTQEIGVRMALGAQAVDVVRLVLGACARSIAIGLAVGFAIAFAVSRTMQAFLYGLSPLDPVTYGGVALMLIAASLAAAYWPARRATRIAPGIALRMD